MSSIELNDEEEYHQCHFCGTDIKDGKEYNGKRHWLSDCRPDLVEHEISDTCTWAFRRNPELNQGKSYKQEETCYAYQNHDTQKWTDKHEHFYKDGPM